MKSKLLLVLLTVSAGLLSTQSQAQTRYQDSIFASYTLDSVTYSTVYGQKMDIYQPAGDAQATRPLIVLAHGGSFVSGTREDDNTITQLCSDFAHKGYVCASIDYRLAPPGNLINANDAALEVFQALSDGKAAVRYFYKDASTTNTYRIDTNNIFIGGNSAGAVLYMQYAYMDDTSKLDINPVYPSLLDSIGGLSGNSGNPGYSNNFKAVINLAGGLNDAAWLSYCGKPVVSAQGDSDMVVPYTCNEPYVYGFHVPLTLCGLGSLQPYITGNTPFSASMVFPGAGHVPWATNDTDFYMIDTMITNFLYAEVMGTAPTACGALPAGIQNVSNTATIDMYPNPANSELNIRSSAIISNISMVDEMGRIVAQTNNVNGLSYQMNTSNLSSGLYFVRISGAQGQGATVKKVTIE